MKREYQEDCIHLKACRRLCKIHKINKRGCNENCHAYVSGEEPELIYLRPLLDTLHARSGRVNMDDFAVELMEEAMNLNDYINEKYNEYQYKGRKYE